MDINSFKLDNLNFSYDTIKYMVLPYYNLQNANVSMIKFKNTLKQRAVFKINLNQKNYCLKKVYYNIENLLYVYSAMEWAYRNNIRVPKLLPTLNNKRFVYYNKMLFILTPWVEGIKCDFDNYNHVISATKKLAELHSCSRNFNPILGSAKREGFDDYYISLLKHFQDLLNSSNQAFKYKDKFSKQFISSFDSNLKLARISLNISNNIDISKLSKSLCHGDYVNKNLIFPKDSIPWIIDFDKCKKDYCMKDLGYFMRRLMRRHNTNWNLELGLNIIKAYNEISPLNEHDFRYIISSLSFPNKFWKISKDYFKNIHKCNKFAFYNLLSNTICKSEQHYSFITNIINIIEDEFSITL